MDHFTRLKRQVINYLTVIILFSGMVLLASWLALDRLTDLNFVVIIVILIVELIALAVIIPMMAADYLLEPVRFLWQAILHVSPDSSSSPAPNLNDSKLGRELITSLCLQVYQLASNGVQNGVKAADISSTANTIAASLPLPLLVMNKDQVIIFANETAHKYLGLQSNELIGKNLYNCLDLSFQTNDTLDSWLNDARLHTITSSRSWERVRLKLPNQDQPLQLDMAAYYNKQNPGEVETIITLFDHTSTYAKEDNSISYVALAVHELRTPLTLLRGYIEVFEEELDGKLDPELADYMTKMEAAGKRLTAFINNILNIARVEADQLVLQLHQEDWNKIVTDVVDDFKSQAKARGKTIKLTLAPNLPAVAADRVSLYEVLSNLIDNALKYSNDGSEINVTTSVEDDSMIQTTVQDIGVGIPTNVLPHLFEKFYRSHHTNDKIKGTGLGLYLAKVIVSAHGGHIWVRSLEGEGTTIGFTIKPYSQLAEEAKNSDNNDITRNAYGWIKNHSLYRK